MCGRSSIRSTLASEMRIRSILNFLDFIRLPTDPGGVKSLIPLVGTSGMIDEMSSSISDLCDLTESGDFHGLARKALKLLLRIFLAFWILM